MNAFNKLHPISKIVYFLSVFVLVLTANNPIFSAVSLCSAMLFLKFGGGKAFFPWIKLAVFVVVTVSIINMLFAHYGETVLFSVGVVNFTLEALFYGFNQGLVMASVMLWFSALSYMSDSGDILYLLRFAPKTALLFTMVLGFIPRFTKKLSDIRDAQSGLCTNQNLTLRGRFKTGLQNLSALVTYSLESSILTADSMTARGYRNGAVSYKRFKMSPRDVACLVFVLIASAFLIWAKAAKMYAFIFEPKIYFKSHSVIADAVFIILTVLPSAIEIGEVLLWKRASSKI
ncbi:MAG: energy-coupling factor transporter transmembrane protein EcfT [Ruminococcaceae bacterium]|nr:energy-coupling factor transporter transmembrane protein EcfT [Oscillospiraceae bacterium]